tara:strand:+ start:3998 stop:4357 length:360 start_codon:yes stop_codon:yes gene_type:complete
MKWQDILKFDDPMALFEDLRREIVEYFPPEYIGNTNTPNSIIGVIPRLIDYLESPMYSTEIMLRALTVLLRKIGKAQEKLTEDENHDEAFEDGNTLFYNTVAGIIDAIREAIKFRGDNV